MFSFLIPTILNQKSIEETGYSLKEREMWDQIFQTHMGQGTNATASAHHATAAIKERRKLFGEQR